MSAARRVAAALLAVAPLLAACSSSSRHRATPVPPSSSAPSTAPATGGATTTARPADLSQRLLTAADLPAGFASSPVPETGGLTLAPCGHLVAPLPASARRGQVGFSHNGDQEMVLEQVGDLGPGGPAALVDQVRQVAAGCPQFDEHAGGGTVTLLVTPLRTPAAGDASAGVQLSTSAQFIDLVVVGSGPLAALLVTTEVGNPMPPDTLDAVVSAAGRRLSGTS